jgi:hypothetical protein
MAVTSTLSVAKLMLQVAKNGSGEAVPPDAMAM